MSVALYIRVSTDEQADQGTSIDVQKERLTAYARSQGWEEVNYYIDDGYSGTNTNRPALKRLIRHANSKRINTVIVYKLDRLGRRQKDVLNLLEDIFEKNDVAFKSATEPFDTSTPLGKAMLGILAVFAQLERDMIIERTTSGRRHRISQGVWHGGRVPFGYSWDGENLKIVPEEAILVKEIYRRYTVLKHSRLSIAEWVSARSKSRAFDHSTIREILSRPVYAGKLIMAGEIVPGNHPAIIDESAWLETQKETAKRSNNNTSPIGEYLLTGLLNCGECRGNIVHVKRKTNKKDRTYIYELYACRNQHVREKDRKVPKCDLGYKRREEVENYVVEAIKNLNIRASELIVRNEDNKNETRIALLDKLKKVNASLDNLYEAIESGEIKASRISDRINRLELEREGLELQIEDIESISDSINPAEFLGAIEQLRGMWGYLEDDEKKSLIKLVIKKVHLSKSSPPIIEWNV